MMLVSYFAGYPNTFSDDTVSPLAHRTACDCNGTAAHGLSGATGPTHLERSRELKLERKKKHYITTLIADQMGQEGRGFSHLDDSTLRTPPSRGKHH